MWDLMFKKKSFI